MSRAMKLSIFKIVFFSFIFSDESTITYAQVHLLQVDKMIFQHRLVSQ